jgi:hypothetical protein
MRHGCDVEDSIGGGGADRIFEFDSAENSLLFARRGYPEGAAPRPKGKPCRLPPARGPRLTGDLMSAKRRVGSFTCG